MFAGLPIGFGAPAVLFALALLPAIWWLLRLVPPRPETEVFPPLRILARLARKDETPAKSPWWLTALRLALSALVIIALAQPILNPEARADRTDGPLLIVLDNDWSASEDFADRIRTAEGLIRKAGDNGQPVAIATSLAAEEDEVILLDADKALERLAGIEPVSGRANRNRALEQLIAVRGDSETPATLAIIASRYSEAGDEALGAMIAAANLDPVIHFSGETKTGYALGGAANLADGFEARLIASADETADQTISAYDSRARLLATQLAVFEDGAKEATAKLDIPFEIRNDIAAIRIDSARNAGGVYLLDESKRRRRVALVTGLGGEEAQPLLSPLFYIEKAITPFADILRPRRNDLALDIPELVRQGPAMLVMADIGVIPNTAREALDEWIAAGGTLVRFAGPRLAALVDDDPYLPVDLRLGERELGGALSWSEPQAVAPFPENGPFADLVAPRDVTVTRQILAEPDAALEEKTWARLTDGTPLVTAERRGKGAIVLFHITAEASWSNLPITGTFVDMLKRIADLSRNISGSAAVTSQATGDALAPLRIVQTNGELSTPGEHVRPLATGNSLKRPDFINPAGLYGTEDGFNALNLYAEDEELVPFDASNLGNDIAQMPLAQTRESQLAGWVFLIAFILLLIDTLAVLLINGHLKKPAFAKTGAATAAIGLALAASLLLAPNPAHAQSVSSSVPDDTRPGDEDIIRQVSATRIAFVITGDSEIDRISEEGLSGLSRFLASRTAFEPGEPNGVDLETDSLAPYPLIYFPISANADLPSENAIQRLDAYMQAGGTVLFDTRDDLTGSLSGGNTPENDRLRTILQDLNIPPLEPVPAEHVLTKSFYILDTFPGRYGGSPLWVEAAPEETGDTTRPVRSGDGVSPILITGNDFASAWALSEQGEPLYAVSSSDPQQRIYAFRAGVNIVMYMLTGNYKADQVHIPALLERLGQ